jgi:phage tail-like protein
LARLTFTDYLQNFPFWLVDIAPIELAAIPIFLPLSGFSSITAPEIRAEVETIVEGNWHPPRKVIKGATLSSITLTRGVTFFNSDFWRWISAAIHGDTEVFQTTRFGLRIGGPTPRRMLMLIHFFARLPFGGDAGINPDTPPLANIGPFEFLARLPARAFLLTGCIPTRYKTGSDFDARSGEISLSELEFELEGIEEIALTA